MIECTLCVYIYYKYFINLLCKYYFCVCILFRNLIFCGFHKLKSIKKLVFILHLKISFILWKQITEYSVLANTKYFCDIHIWDLITIYIILIDVNYITYYCLIHNWSIFVIQFILEMNVFYIKWNYSNKNVVNTDGCNHLE